MIGFAMTGSFCTHAEALEALGRLAVKYDVMPILSETAISTDTRFGTAADLKMKLYELTGREPLHTVKEVEPFGPSDKLEALIIAPCTGTTASRIARGISDTAPAMAAKATLRNSRPVLLAIATNDAMSANFSSIAALANRKNVFLVPMRQDDPVKKPDSLVADFKLIPDALSAAFERRQLRPLFL